MYIMYICMYLYASCMYISLSLSLYDRVSNQVEVSRDSGICAPLFDDLRSELVRTVWKLCMDL